MPNLLTKDNLKNTPDACCQVHVYEKFCDGETGCSADHEFYCLQIKKDKADDFINYIYEESSLAPYEITITCDGVEVYKWKYNSSFYIESIGMFLLLLSLLLLF